MRTTLGRGKELCITQVVYSTPSSANELDRDSAIIPPPGGLAFGPQQ